MGGGAKLAIAAGVALVMASGAHSGGHGILSELTSSAVPASIAYSRTAWAHAFLADIPEPETPANLCSVVTWETREGGGFGNQAANNPLNLNPGSGAGWPGSPAIGAWAFPDAPTGLAYTVRVVRSYPGILAALHRGDSAQSVLNAVMASPWAASHYGGTLTADC